MLFLMNDALIQLTSDDLLVPMREAQVQSHALSFDFIRQLGCEVFANEPMLQVRNPDKARRLAALIVAREPQINAALFVAPKTGCLPEDVQCRFVSIGLEIVGLLKERQELGILTNVYADRQVWRRLAA
jgi:hypothetical protein